MPGRRLAVTLMPGRPGGPAALGGGHGHAGATLDEVNEAEIEKLTEHMTDLNVNNMANAPASA